MLGIHDFPLFVVSGILLNLTPGQDTVYVIGRSVAQGRKAGVMSMLGVSTGILVHTLLAALGISVILAASPLAFAAVKLAGAGYLIWLGIGFLKKQKTDEPIGPNPVFEATNPLKIYWQGVLTNTLNPKVALFFLSFLPQFISAQAQMVVLPFLVLGLVFLITGGLWLLFLVIGASWLSTRFRKYAAAGSLLKKLTGLLFVGLGIRLAFLHR